MSGEIIRYQTEVGAAVVRFQARDDSVWLSQLQMAELFQTSVPNIKAKAKAERESDAWHARAISASSAVDRHFAEAIGATKRIAAEKKVTSQKGARDAS